MKKRQQLFFTGFELADMEKEAIEFLQQHQPPEGYYLGFSGGKDSITTLHLAKLAGVKYTAGYSCTGIDHPDVVRMIRREYPEVKFIFPRKPFWQMLKTRFPPMRMARWCCRELKEGDSLGLNNLVFGIRAEESARRAKRGRISTYQNKTHYNPIFNWPEWAVWEFIEKYNLVYPSLYDEGFQRIGCVVCPFLAGSSPNRIKLRARHQERYPGIWRVYKNCVKYWWDHRPKNPKDKFKDFETFYEYYWNN